MLVPFDGRLFIARDRESLTPLLDSEGAIDAQLSQDGSHVAFVRSGEIQVVPTDRTGKQRALTSGAVEGVTNGLAEYIAQEEMERLKGFWWSPDSKHIAFVRANSRHIPKYPIVHQGAEQVAVEEHRYPFAGAQNTIVQLGIVALNGRSEEVTWMDLGANDDIYLARVTWKPDGVLTALIQSRDQRDQRLVAFDSLTGAATTLIEEQGHPWLNLHDDLRFLRSGAFIWSNERTGFRHLYAVSLDGSPIRRLTGEPGWHDAVISPDHRSFVDIWQSPNQPPRLALRRLANGETMGLLFESEGIASASLGLSVPEITGFHTSDGVLLYAAIYASEQTRSVGQKRPLVVSVYGGPMRRLLPAPGLSLSIFVRSTWLNRASWC